MNTTPKIDYDMILVGVDENYYKSPARKHKSRAMKATLDMCCIPYDEAYAQEDLDSDPIPVVCIDHEFKEEAINLAKTFGREDVYTFKLMEGDKAEVRTLALTLNAVPTNRRELKLISEETAEKKGNYLYLKGENFYYQPTNLKVA